MKVSDTAEFAAYIGIDWADDHHDICEIARGSSQSQHSIIKHRPEDIHHWAMSLLKRYHGEQIAVACELRKGPLINALRQYEHLVIFPINPTTVANHRKAFANSGSKSDAMDATIQTEILLTYPERLAPLNVEKKDIRILDQLVVYRRQLVQSSVDMTNKITSVLKLYYPQALDWFEEKDSVIFCDFLLKWPTLQMLQRARASTIMDFFNAHHSRYTATNEARIEHIKQARPLTQDTAFIIPNQMMVSVLVPQLKILIEAIKKLDGEIRHYYRKQPDYCIFDSFPGAGPQMGPRLMVAMGTDRARYPSAADIQKYAGIAPVIEASGKKSWTHWRYHCPIFLRQTFVEWAGLSRRYSFWAQAYYEQQIKKGKHHNTAIRSLAFKWIRILFRCWQNHTPYDESTYLTALKKRKSPLLENAIME